jgi:hypothetical protein
MRLDQDPLDHAHVWDRRLVLTDAAGSAQTAEPFIALW